MSRYWKAALPFLLAAVIILAAASRPVVLHIGFPCDSYWNVPGENYYTFIDAAIEKFEAEPTPTVKSSTPAHPSKTTPNGSAASTCWGRSRM